MDKKDDIWLSTIRSVALASDCRAGNEQLRCSEHFFEYPYRRSNG